MPSGRLVGMGTRPLTHGFMLSRQRLTAAIGSLLIGLLITVPAQGQPESLKRGSDNIEVVGHIPLGKRLTVLDIELEQDLDRPYAYVARASLVDGGPRGTDVIDISDPTNPEVIVRWRLEDQDLHANRGGMDVKYFRWKERHYIVQSYEFGAGGPTTTSARSSST